MWQWMRLPYIISYPRAIMLWCNSITQGSKTQKAKTTLSSGIMPLSGILKKVPPVDFLMDQCWILLNAPRKDSHQEKRKNMKTLLSFCQVNAWSHVAACFMATISKLLYGTFSHIIFTVWTSHYNLSGHQKGEERYHSTEDMKIQAVQEWINLQPKDFFLSSICKLPYHWCKRTACHGYYMKSSTVSFGKWSRFLLYYQNNSYCPTFIQQIVFFGTNYCY